MSAQVGVRTRARAALAMEPQPPKRKATTIATTSTDDQDRKSSKASRTENLPDTDECNLSPTSSEIQASCCSSSDTIGLDTEKIKLLDLEVESAQVETSTCNGAAEQIERKLEMNSSSKLPENSQELESVEIDSRHSLSAAQKMPTELELEEFFAAAEKDIQKQFQDKYNYDIVKDVPLEGRYEWVQLKP
ncbi:cyclin-dependent kinase inhibitor 7 [Cajanus cajan]|uniref:Cyclin-dependent kinase inhibitor n=1 Tax=Cajanus cajan TaxID=3821 RepID=A0A151TIH0_CAJCA|nr:cyclin-dependent kinase inhibitor 7 [Cajanus cajan]KYP66854.1 Cyclin-dependent kinase inhibitor 7 [Cajanus cajan]